MSESPNLILESYMRVRAKSGHDKALWHDKKRLSAMKSCKSKVAKNVKVVNKVNRSHLD